MVVDVSAHDFGEIDDQSTQSCIFKVWNRGTGTLIIEKVESDRNCLIPQTIQNLELSPDGALDLEVRFNPHRLLGEQTRTIRVLSNDPDTHELELHLRAEIRIDYRLTQSHLYFKQIDYDTQLCESVEVKSYLDQPLIISHLKPSHDFFTAVFRTVPEDGTYFIDIKLDGRRYPSSQDRIAGKLFFEVNSRRKPQGSLILLFSRADGLLPKDPLLTAHDLVPEEEQVQRIELINKLDKEYKIVDVSFTDDLVEIRDWSKEDDTIVIRYHIDERIEYDIIEGSFILSLDLEQPSKIVVPFHGMIADKVAYREALK
ncbi:MAG: DUF1573 domain-containing protein, partial [Planctomycetes bacterium]|nr:DUF1573 domain-containing protein [Planctomycetota bacterium]